MLYPLHFLQSPGQMRLHHQNGRPGSRTQNLAQFQRSQGNLRHGNSLFFGQAAAFAPQGLARIPAEKQEGPFALVQMFPDGLLPRHQPSCLSGQPQKPLPGRPLHLEDPA
ncbi:MAG: hypothetical protein QJR00_03230 [Bacillota bacterium]|nr:hypothetical protein [Bacillota bacterium]